ncbi:hypothetical protein ACIQ34_01540 [Ureibacillus sp. NPDC094379]
MEFGIGREALEVNFIKGNDYAWLEPFYQGMKRGGGRRAGIALSGKEEEKQVEGNWKSPHQGNEEEIGKKSD